MNLMRFINGDGAVSCSFELRGESLGHEIDISLLTAITAY
jgi:hypothetical protein